mgnify:FL=1
MLLYNKVVFVYDVEIFPNLFTCTILNTNSEKIGTYEISNRKNELGFIVSTFSNSGIIWCGYNNRHYDDPVINYIILNQHILSQKPVWEVTRELKKFSDEIINSGDKFDSWAKYKHAHCFPSFDLLTMMFSQKLRCGLKELQVTMQYPNVQEYEGDFNSNISESEIDNVIAYNHNDVNSTYQLLKLKQKDIDLRVGIHDEYGVNVMSVDGVGIGKEILKTKYLQATGKTWGDIKDLRSPRDKVKLNEVILPKISFETKILQDLLNEMKELTVSPGIKGWNKQFYFYNSLISIGVGGLHNICKPEIIIPTDDEILVDWDAMSLYPSLLISYEFYPQHLGVEFLNVYKKIREERIEAKHNGNKVKNETLKLALNSATGNMQSEYSWLYDPKSVMKIRMNGQLFLLKLAEMLILGTNCRIIQYNTDGIFVLIKRNMLDKANDIIKSFEKFSLLTMEADYFEAMYQFAINDYIAVKEGYNKTKDSSLIKKKGIFIDTPTLGKGLQPLIIPKTICKYFVDKIPIEETLYNSDDIREFCTYQKVDKKFHVMYGGKEVTRINRFYMSKYGSSLIKYEMDYTGKKIRPTTLCSSSSVTLLNKFDNLSTKDKHINYLYYKNEIYKIINALETEQLTLF